MSSTSAIINKRMKSSISKIVLASSSQLKSRKYVIVQSENAIDDEALQSYLGNSFKKNKIVSVGPEKDFEETIKMFLITNLRKYYIAILWSGFGLLVVIEGIRSAILKYLNKGVADIERALHWRKLAEIGLPLVSMVVMILLCVTVYRLLTTASIIKIKKESIDLK